MQNPLRVAVLSLDGQDHACGYLRLVAPLTRCRPGVELRWAVACDGKSAKFDTAAVDWADVVVIQRAFPHPLTKEVIDELFASGKPLIYEVDDLLTSAPESNPHVRSLELCKPQILEVMKRATALTVSTERLAEAYADMNANIHVLPNLVDLNLFRRNQRTPKERVTIGYAGTPTHVDDLMILDEVIRKSEEKFGERVRFWFMGCITSGMARIAGVEFLPMQLSYQEYASTLSGCEIDFALVPLVDNVFNRCKSNIKWLEYSACGIPGIYSDLPPYSTSIVPGENGILAAGDERAWIEGITKLVLDPSSRERIADRAYEEVASHHSLSENATIWRETYERILGRRAPRPAARRCSIIIPVFNRLELTRQCLDELFRTTPLNGVDVIVIDNGSSDGSSEYLRSLGNRIRLIQNETNLGFASACNQGARATDADVLVFLNNDTIPQPGWLDPLLEEAEQHADVGVVGSKLLYPHGAIQHAGVAFARPDGVPYHIYQGGPSDHPGAGHRRELRAVTGACMLVRRALFESLGGFDEGFRNGFEDIDLCLKVRRAGAKVIYQPSSVVVHLEEQTPGRKDFDSENLKRFLEMWPRESVPDETGVLLEDGFVARSVKGEPGCRMIEPVGDSDERKRWTCVAETELRVAEQGLSALRAAPPRAEDWPDDSETLRWGARLCSSVGLAELAAQFESRAVAPEHVEARITPEARFFADEWLERGIRAFMRGL
jgi:GT2 family glycosyltransferase/glycosyltransferase involved in cell wall biosynthesis